MFYEDHVTCLLSDVLIETYWNVNLRGAYTNAFTEKGINRNILECKFGKSLWVNLHLPVLIETYWNVNMGYAILQERPTKY